jgi:hypothetical protein
MPLMMIRRKHLPSLEFATLAAKRASILSVDFDRFTGRSEYFRHHSTSDIIAIAIAYPNGERSKSRKSARGSA